MREHAIMEEAFSVQSVLVGFVTRTLLTDSVEGCGFEKW
jgi:hypothetical protein